MEVQCRVVYRKEIEKGRYEVALEFSKPFPRFWGINFPPEDWNPAERKKAGSPVKQNSTSTKGQAMKNKLYQLPQQRQQGTLG